MGLLLLFFEELTWSLACVLLECTVEGRIQEIGSERGYQARYVEIEMVKQDGKWLIAGMKEVKALE